MCKVLTTPRKSSHLCTCLLQSLTFSNLCLAEMKWKQLLRRLTWNANENTASKTSRPLVGRFATQKACSACFITFLLVNSWSQLVASLDFWLQTKMFCFKFFFSLIFRQRNGILKSFAFWDLKKFKDYSHVDFISTYWTDETIIIDNTLFYHNMNQSLVLTFYLNKLLWLD